MSWGAFAWDWVEGLKSAFILISLSVARNFEKLTNTLNNTFSRFKQIPYEKKEKIKKLWYDYNDDSLSNDILAKNNHFSLY